MALPRALNGCCVQASRTGFFLSTTPRRELTQRLHPTAAQQGPDLSIPWPDRGDHAYAQQGVGNADCRGFQEHRLVLVNPWAGAQRGFDAVSRTRPEAGACVRPAEEPNGTGNPRGRNGPRRTGRAHPRACRERAGRRKSVKPAPAALPLEQPGRAVARYFFAKKAPLTLSRVKIPAASSAFGP